MPKLSSVQFRLEKLKKQARKLSKTQGITRTEALEKVALEAGYASWFDCRKSILEAPSTNQTSSTKDSSNSKVRLSMLNYVGEPFRSLNAFRNRLESEIRSVITNSKHCQKICVRLYVDTPTMEMFDDPSSMFDSIMERYERLDYFRVIVRDTPQTAEEMALLLGLNPEADYEVENA